MSVNTDIREFERFHNQLIHDYPQYKPHYLLLKKNDKAPMGAFGAPEFRLDFDVAKAKMAEGYNIGIAGTSYDGLVIIDVDDREAFADHSFIDTLKCRSSSRVGEHYFYNTFDTRCKVNIALADLGELRTNWQYVVCPGSFVDIVDAIDKDGNITKTRGEFLLDIPENDRANAGKYTVENESGLSNISFDGIPDIFKRAENERAETDKEIVKKRAERIATPKQEVNNNKSALYDLKISDVINVSTDENFASVFHGSKTGKNTVIKDNLLHCFRCQVSHTALTALSCLAGMHTCVDAGTGHKGSGSGMSHVDTDDGETIFKLWDYAKSNGYIPENDKIPAKALVYYAVSNGVCNESDVTDGWKLTPKAYTTALNLLNGVIEPESIAALRDNNQNLFDADSNGGNCKLRFIEVSDMLAVKHNAISYKDIIYVYSDGIYIDGTETIKTEIANLSKEFGCKCGVTNSMKEIMAYMTYDNPEKEYPFNTHNNMIPVKNGIVVIDFDKRKFDIIPHNPKFKFNYKFGIDFKQPEDLTLKGVIDSVFKSYVDEPDVDILYQIPAQAILQGLGSSPFKKAYLLQGDPHAAKSGYLELLSRMFGEDSISHISLQAIGSDRFALANLEGKTFNTYDDLSSIPIKDGGVFKTLTGGHSHEVQRKGIQGHRATITAVHVYTCNTPPQFDKSVQHDTAFWERWEYVRFVNVFDVDPYFYDNTFTQTNLERCFYSILEYVVSVHNDGLKVNSTASEVREKWSFSADPLYMYIKANLNESERSMYIDKELFMESYKRWCLSNGIDNQKIITAKKAFTQAIDKYGVLSTRTTDANGVRISCYEIPYTWNVETKHSVKNIALRTQQDKL